MTAIIFIPLLLIIFLAPCLIVMLWQGRPVLAFVTALILSYVLCVAPEIIQTFQAMMIYGEGDPQLMAGGIASALILGIFGTLIYVPFLFLFQWFGRLRKKKRERAKIDEKAFD